MTQSTDLHAVFADSKDVYSDQRRILPAGYHCAVTWGIPVEYGGMTNALLHRSRAFVAEAGANVDVLTFEWYEDYDEIRCELEVAGELVPGVRLRNMWDELESLSDDELAAAGPLRVTEFTPLARPEEFVEERSGGVTRRRLRYAADDKTCLQVDYFRPNGTLLAVDRRDAQLKGEVGGRVLTLCNHAGEPVASWRQVWPLYLFWLDHAVRGRETFMIVDSKSTANFMTRYRRDHVITMHLVHNSHMAAGATPPHGELSRTRRYVFDRLDTFDSVVFLTKSQKRDVDVLLGQQANTCVVPNSRNFYDIEDPVAGHTPDRGIILASLAGRKRLDHAIRAVGRARETGTLSYSLDIYGHGPEQGSLRKVISAGGLDASVTLKGYSIDARKEFADASFTLLTSKLEGQGLVLIEAMSAGCIPISYDVPYGPADIIQDGVNGFLVAEGDLESMAERIVQLSRMDPLEVAAMRRAAVASAHDFNDEFVVRQWGAAMRSAVDRKLASFASTTG